MMCADTFTIFSGISLVLFWAIFGIIVAHGDAHTVISGISVLFLELLRRHFASGVALHDVRQL